MCDYSRGSPCEGVCLITVGVLPVQCVSDEGSPCEGVIIVGFSLFRCAHNGGG